uniref:Uncharacterized protein n=1 Tax=Varanus komodoensis TaxID=61221 RepID=A0A8D2L7G4_VARKO
MNFEDLLQEAGGFGKFQVLTLLLLCLPRVLLPLHFLLHNFLAAIPPHHCAIPHQEQFANLTEEDVLLINIPRDLEETFSSCEMFSSPQFHLLLNSTWAPTNSTSAQKCQHGWVYDHSQFTATIATQVSLSPFAFPSVLGACNGGKESVARNRKQREKDLLHSALLPHITFSKMFRAAQVLLW